MRKKLRIISRSMRVKHLLNSTLFSEHLKSYKGVCVIARFNDLTGKKFDRLLVISSTDRRGADGSVVWECRCDCGNTAFVTSTNLKSNNSRSCGCYAMELAVTRIKHNEYSVSTKGYYVGKTSNTNKDFFFDKLILNYYFEVKINLYYRLLHNLNLKLLLYL